MSVSVPTKRRVLAARHKRKAFELYMQGLTAYDIADKIGTHPQTIYNWSSERDAEGKTWGEYRRGFQLDYRGIAEQMLRSAVVTLDSSIRTAGKILNRIECQLDASTPCSPLKTLPSESVAEQHRNAVAESRSNELTSNDLAQLAKALSDASSVLLRVFSK